MKYAIGLFLLILWGSCKNETQERTLPKKGLWTNYKYPMYLQDMRSARYVQQQIYVTMIEFREGDSLVWVQFRLHDWQGFKPFELGNGKWILRRDTSDIVIPLELTPKGNELYVTNEAFEFVKNGGELGPAYSYYADNYYLNKIPVRLKPDGSIQNLDTFIAYKPIIDYTAEPGTGDRIWLQSASGTWKKFGLVIPDWDALEIYTLRNNRLGKKLFHLDRAIKPVYIY